MSEFTVTRTLKGPRERVWQVLTQPSQFEGWLPGYMAGESPAAA